MNVEPFPKEVNLPIEDQRERPRLVENQVLFYSDISLAQQESYFAKPDQIHTKFITYQSNEKV